MTMATGDLRNHARKRVLMQASIISAHGTHSARIVDLNVSGVRISCEPPLEKDSDVIFKRGKLFVAARVAWTMPGGAGRPGQGRGRSGRRTSARVVAPPGASNSIAAVITGVGQGCGSRGSTVMSRRE